MKYSWYEMLGGSLLLTAWVLYGANWIGNALTRVEPAPVAEVSEMAAPAAVAETAAPAPTMAEAADLPTLLASADAAAGKKVFGKCKSCHDASSGGKNKVGPNLWGIVGAGKAAAAGFKYSGALAGLGGTWTFADLDGFLASPKTFAPGTRMSFRGVSKPADRAALIAYLNAQSASPVPLP